MHNTALEARVAGQNKVNQLAIDAYAQAYEVLDQFVGQKVCKVDGTLLKKVSDALPKLPEGCWYSVGHGYSLVVNAKVCECVPTKDGHSHAYYSEATAYLAELRDGVLTKLYDEPKFRTDFTVEGITKARDEFRAARANLDAKQSALAGFGEYDR